jgi:putative ABC transport system ATP-binding protein
MTEADPTGISGGTDDYAMDAADGRDTEPAAYLRDVHLRIGTTTALAGIDLDVRAGEFLSVTGRSGAGKSSLVNVIGGLMRPTRGVVVVEGTELASASAATLAAVRRRHIGVVFQRLNLVPELTAYENVAMPLQLDGIDRDKAKAQACAGLQDVGLGKRGDAYPDQLSGGEQQRVAIARALIGSRRLLLADEPTAALDNLTAETIMGLLRNKADQGAAVVLVTHDSSLAAWADRIIRLRHGFIQSETSGPTSGSPLGIGEPA